MNTSCPITAIRITQKNFTQAAAATYDWQLDKNTDALPLTAFAVEFKPCATPVLTSRNPNAVFYPLEEDRKDGCLVDKVSNKTYDERYKNLGLSVSEFDMQSRSGVLNRISSSPLSFNSFQPSIDRVKNQIHYSLFARSTITWNLECETNTTRQDIMKLFSTAKEDKNFNMNVLLYFTITFLVIASLLLCAGANAAKPACLTCTGILFAAQLAFGICCWFYNGYA